MDTSQQVDSDGTSQAEAVYIIRTLRDQAFDSSNEKLGVALGRPVEEIEGWLMGSETIDDDVVMKARGIADQRGVEID